MFFFFSKIKFLRFMHRVLLLKMTFNIQMVKTVCVVGKDDSGNANQNVTEKVNPKTDNLVTLLKIGVVLVFDVKVKFFSSKWQEKVLRKRKRHFGPCSSRTNSVWCDLSTNGTILNLHDIWPNSKHKCPKQKTFTPRNLELESKGHKRKLKKNWEALNWKNDIEDPKIYIRRKDFNKNGSTVWKWTGNKRCVNQFK